VTKKEKTCHCIGNNVTTFHLVNFSGKSPSYFWLGMQLSAASCIGYNCKKKVNLKFVSDKKFA